MRSALLGMALGWMIMATGCGDVPDDDGGRDTLLPDAVGEWVASGEVQAWDPESIYDYIDGHAEVYLAYGMTGARSRVYEGPGEEPDMIVDVFEMPSPADAYGVFTHQRQGEAVGIGQGSAMTGGWLSFWKGPRYVSVTAEAESEAALAAVTAVALEVAAGIEAEGAAPELVHALPGEGLDAASVVFLRDRQILDAHLYLGTDDVLGLDGGAEAALARYEFGEARPWLLLVEYPSEEAAQRWLGEVRRVLLDGGTAGSPIAVGDDGWWGVRREGDRLALVVRSGSEDAVEELLARALTEVDQVAGDESG